MLQISGMSRGYRDLPGGQRLEGERQLQEHPALPCGATSSARPQRNAHNDGTPGQELGEAALAQSPWATLLVDP